MREAKTAGKRARLSKPEMAQREKAIIADIKAGELSYREIALKHGVSLPTVNNKARKAGISRGRRKGARLVVPRPARKTGARKAARRGTKKAGRRGRRPAAAMEETATSTMGTRKARGGRRKAGRRSTRRVGRPRGVGRPRLGRPRGRAQSGEAFAGAFRELVLKHFPTISLVKFDRLARMVENEVA